MCYYFSDPSPSSSHKTTSDYLSLFLFFDVALFFILFDVCILNPQMYPLFAVDDQRSFDIVHSHHFDWWYAFICFYADTLVLWHEMEISVHIFIFIFAFVALSGKQKSQQYQINQQTPPYIAHTCTALVSQMNHIVAIVLRIGWACLQTFLCILCVLNPFVYHRKLLPQPLEQLFTMVSSGWSV